MGVDLTEAQLVETKLVTANLVIANLTGASLKGANLNKANLAFAVLKGADLSGADLGNANLAGVDLSEVNLENANLEGTILEPPGVNQGVRFIPKMRIINWNGLRFRSNSEVKFAQALDKKGLLYYPNAIARLNVQENRQNKESDFLICAPTPKGFRWGIVEIDGPFHTPEKRATEQERERVFEHSGVRVYRFDSKRCDKNPDAVVEEFLELLSKS